MVDTSSPQPGPAPAVDVAQTGESAPLSAAAPEDQRLPTHWPGLDGLRGLAVGVVLVFHGGFTFARGGFLGVTLFFALSGFLITSLVLREWESNGRVSLTAFWARRARRLLPASYVALLGAIAAAYVALPAGQRFDVMGDVRASALNLANLRFMRPGDVEVAALPSPVLHYWSLAIEEQFYILFPVVAAVALRFRRMGLTIVFGAVVIVALIGHLTIDDANRVYFGTDTRAAEIAFGGLLALGRERLLAALRGWRLWVPDACGALGLVAIVILWWRVSFETDALYDGGLLAAGLVCTLLVFGAVDGRLLPRLLANRLLVGLGLISYGAYLYHFPIFLVLDERRLDLDRWPMFALRMIVTLVVSVLSYQVLERPVRRSSVLPGQRSTVAFVVGLALVIGATMAVSWRLETQGVSDSSERTSEPQAVGPDSG